MSATPPCSPNTRRNQENLSPKHLTRHENPIRREIEPAATSSETRKQRARAISGRGRIEMSCSVISPSGTASPCRGARYRTSILPFPADVSNSRRGRTRLAALRHAVTFRPISLTASSEACTASRPVMKKQAPSSRTAWTLASACARSTRDHCNLTLSFPHDSLLLQAPPLVVSGRPHENLDMGLPASGV